MLIRIISSLVAIPLLIVFVNLGGLWLKIAVLIVSLMGMYEFYMAVSKKLSPAHFLGFAIEIAYMLMVDTITMDHFRIIASLAVLLMLLCLVICHSSITAFDVAVSLFGFFYVGFLLANMYIIREMDKIGSVLIWVPLICAWGCDTGAYFIGCAFGKHKMAPVLSPKKSWEGAFGGSAVAALLCGLFGIIAFKLGMSEENYALIFALFGLIGSVFSQLGDLAASSIKRQVGIKDYGKIMPGHGGVLDRFDSVLVTLPIIFVLSQLVNI